METKTKKGLFKVRWIHRIGGYQSPPVYLRGEEKEVMEKSSPLSRFHDVWYPVISRIPEKGSGKMKAESSGRKKRRRINIKPVVETR